MIAIILRVILCVLFFGALFGVFLGDGLGMLRAGLFAVIMAIALATNEIVQAVTAMREDLRLSLLERRPRRADPPAAAYVSPGPSQPQPVPLGKRSGETDEQWAARMEAAEIASFKARNQK